MREVILDEQYWMKTLELQALLKPFLQVIIALELNKPKLSCLYAYYTWLLSQPVSLFSTPSALLPSPIPNVVELIRKRWNKIYHPLLTIAYLADPTAWHNRPVKVTEKQMEGVGAWLFQHYNSNKEKVIKVFTNLLYL